MKEWLENLKPGDKVIVSTRNTNSIATVDRLTKTQIILKGNSQKYKIDSGHSIGTSQWLGSNLIEATEELLLEININRMRGKLLRADWKNIPAEKIIKLFNILKVT